MKKSCLPFAVVIASLSFVTSAAAQYPAQPIKVLVSNPGGGPDVIGRLIGQRLGEVFHQPVVVENRPGSNGVIASDITAKAAPNGYTLLLGPEGNVVINPHLYARMPFDPLKDLAPVASIFRGNFVLAVHPSVPVKNFQEFIEYARKANPVLSYASGGNGSQHQLIMEMLKSRAGIDLMHVPYKGGSVATMAVVAGDVTALFAGPSNISQIRSGKLRPIAVSGEKRSSAFPDLPTVAEFYPGASINPWAGLFAPSGTPRAIVVRLHDEVNKVLAQPDIAEKFDRFGGVEPFITSLENIGALLQAQYVLYGKLVKDIGVTLD